MSNSDFPAAIDKFFDPTVTTTLDDTTNPHHLIESRQNDAIDAIEIKVGVDGSTDTKSLDWKVSNIISGGIPIRFYVGLDSVQISGSNISLVNDIASPGNNQVYGTDGTGTRGWLNVAGLPIAWTSLTGIPATFAPSAHGSTHAGNGTDSVPLATATIAGLVPAKPNAGVNATTTQVVMGDDTRLTNSRSPTAHATTHAHGGTDAVTITYTDLSGIPASFNPSTHAPSHKSGGGDPIAVDTLAAPTDITTLNASTGAHGLLPKLAGGTTSFLRADGTWVAPPGIAYSGINSITIAGANISLVNDSAAPGNNFLYGTSGTGVLGWRAVTGLPLATTAAPGHLTQVSGNTTDFVDGTNNCQNLVNAVQPTIWSARLRAFNSLGNSTFEIDQRNAGAVVTPSNSTGYGYLTVDRWMIGNKGTMQVTGQRITPAAPITIPGTNFPISNAYFRITLTTAQASLAAGNYVQVWTNIEGPQLRELITDVHSVSLLVRSSVANLKFGLNLQDQPSTHCLSKLCTLGAANTWTLLTFPNLPLWTASGAFPLTPGGIGYYLQICLAAASDQTAPANDTWQNATFSGALGQASFAAQAVSSTFDIAYIGHEAGALCTTPQDYPFTKNYDDCLRYMCKSYNYSQALGTASTGVAPAFFVQSSPASGTAFRGFTPFSKPLAKSPTVTAYHYSTGAANSVNDFGGATLAVSSINSNEKVIASVATTTASSYGGIYFHYGADTGW